MPPEPASEGADVLSGFDVSWSDAALHRIHAVVRSVVAISLGYGLLATDDLADGPAFVLVVGAFCAYALVLQWLATRESNLPDARPIHAVDAVWYLALVVASGGAKSVLPFLLFFPVLFASLQYGFAYGFSIAAVSAAVVLALGVLVQQGAGLAWTKLWLAPEFWLAPLSLLVLGYFIAGWASSVIDMRRYIVLVRELSGLPSPRIGLGSLVGEILARMCGHFQADAGVLVTAEYGKPCVFRFSSRQASTTLVPPESAPDLVAQLLALPAATVVAYEERWHWGRRGFQCIGPNGARIRCPEGVRQACTAIVNLLECSSLISAPVYHRGQAAGRLFLANDRRTFRRRDLGLLRQIAMFVSALLENVALVDRLVGEAAEYERKRLSRDIHDSAIQPYIGIKFGLEALGRKLAPEHPLSADVHHLLQMTSAELVGLRQVVGGLRSKGGPNGAALLPTVRQQATRFSELFGIQVEVSAEGEMPDDKQLEAEIFHMVGEGLSNVWRHTEGRKANIHLGCQRGWLTLEILNDRGQEAEEPPGFIPASIAERAATLGGGVRVEFTDDGQTAVTVRIPVQTQQGGTQ